MLRALAFLIISSTALSATFVGNANAQTVPGQAVQQNNQPAFLPTTPQRTDANDPLQDARENKAAAANAAAGAPRPTTSTRSTLPGNLKDLGLEQKAWENPMENKSKRQVRPGYIRFLWSPDDVAQINVREGMLTVVKFPEQETLVGTPYTSDPSSFEVTVAPNKRSFIVRALFGGIDGNVIAYGASGNVYNFYLRSMAYNSKTLPDTTVQISVPGMASATGETKVTATPTSALYNGYKDLFEPDAEKANAAFKNGSKEFGRTTPVAPQNMSNNINIRVRTASDQAIAPVRAWHDDHFTYLDFGPKASSMNTWPVASLVVQGVESPIGTRVSGRDRSMMIIEGVGNVTLRNGDLLVCLDTIMPNNDPRYSIPPVNTDPRPAKIINAKETVFVDEAAINSGKINTSNGIVVRDTNFPAAPKENSIKAAPTANAKITKPSAVQTKPLPAPKAAPAADAKKSK